MNSNEHKTRQRFLPYETDSYLLYLNEKKVKITEHSEDPDEKPVTTTGYSYSGNMEDGSTKIEARDVNDANRRDKFISGLIRARFSADKIEAIILNGDDTPEHAAELADLQNYRRECKDAIDELLNR